MMSSTATKPSAFQRFWNLDWKLKILIVVIIPIALFLGGLLLLNSFNYSVGERTGVISKLSQKGIACWTWEGQLAQPNFSKSSALGAGGRNSPVDNTFEFSVPDPEARKRLENIPRAAPLRCNIIRSSSCSTCRCRSCAAGARSSRSRACGSRRPSRRSRSRSGRRRGCNKTPASAERRGAAGRRRTRGGSGEPFLASSSRRYVSRAAFAQTPVAPESGPCSLAKAEPATVGQRLARLRSRSLRRSSSEPRRARVSAPRVDRERR